MAQQNEKYNEMLNSFLKHVLEGIERVNNQFDKITEQFQNYRTYVQNTFQEISHSLADLRSKANDIDKYKRDLESLDKDVSDITRDLVNIDLTIKDLTRRLTLVENQNTEDKRADDTINKDYVTLVAQVSILKDKIKELEEHIKTLNAKGGIGGSIGGSVGGIITGIIVKFLG